VASRTSVSVSTAARIREGQQPGSDLLPSTFDLFALGGSSSAILPPGLDRNRVESPALPAAAQVSSRFEAYRAELSPSGSPLVLYAERMRAWSSGAEKPDWIRLEGIELGLERLIPQDVAGNVSLYLASPARAASRASTRRADTRDCSSDSEPFRLLLSDRGLGRPQCLRGRPSALPALPLAHAQAFRGQS